MKDWVHLYKLLPLMWYSLSTVLLLTRLMINVHHFHLEIRQSHLLRRAIITTFEMHKLKVFNDLPQRGERAGGSSKVGVVVGVASIFLNCKSTPQTILLITQNLINCRKRQSTEHCAKVAMYYGLSKILVYYFTTFRRTARPYSVD